MTLWVHVHGGYASYEGVHDWGQAEHDAHKFVQTLKGNPINGYARLKNVNGQWQKFTTGNPAPAFRIWASWAALRAAEIAPNGALLVPVPSASCTEVGADAKGRKLAESISAIAPQFEATDALCWKEVWKKAAEGGSRDPDELFGNILVRTSLPKHQVILIDDVVTGGGHLIAAARALRWAGHKVENAICAAHTVKSPPPFGMFNIPRWDLEANPFVG